MALAMGRSWMIGDRDDWWAGGGWVGGCGDG